MKNKKGISAIVATVLIILITVAAVTIIWAAIIPMIQNTIEGSQECFDASASVSVSTDFSCVTHTEVDGSEGVCTLTSKPSQTCATAGDVEVADAAACTALDSATCAAAFVLAVESGTIEVQVEQGTGDFTLVGLEIVVGAAGTTTTFPQTDTPGVNGEKVYYLDYTGAKNTEAGVAAVVEAGKTKETCDRSGMIPIPDCV
jgi:flagellin-like protein